MPASTLPSVPVPVSSAANAATFSIQELDFATSFNERAEAARANSAAHGFWDDYPRNKGEMLMLIVTEVAEAMEGLRKNLQDDHLPHRSMVEAELADVVIRVGDFAAGFGLDVGGAIVEKMRYNAGRPFRHGKLL